MRHTDCGSVAEALKIAEGMLNEPRHKDDPYRKLALAFVYLLKDLRTKADLTEALDTLPCPEKEWYR